MPRKSVPRIDQQRIDDDLARIQAKREKLQTQLARVDEEENALQQLVARMHEYTISDGGRRKRKTRQPVAKARAVKSRVAKTRVAKARRARKDVAPTRQPRRAKTEARGNGKTRTRFRPHRFPPTPIPQGFKSDDPRIEIIRSIAENFGPDAEITANAVINKLGKVGTPHSVAALLINEDRMGPGAILKKIGKGVFQIKSDAVSRLQSRVHSEIADREEAAARQEA